MKRKIEYTDEPLGKLRIVKDFLPGPHNLVFREESVGVVGKHAEPKRVITRRKKSIKRLF